MFLHVRLLLCTVRVEELLDGIREQIPTFQGVKFSDTDLLDLAQCINKNGSEQFAFLYGVDEVRGSLEEKNNPGQSVPASFAMLFPPPFFFFFFPSFFC